MGYFLYLSGHALYATLCDSASVFANIYVGKGTDQTALYHQTVVHTRIEYPDK